MGENIALLVKARSGTGVLAQLTGAIASPSMTPDTRAHVPASRANQHVVSERGACGSMPVTGSRPWVGRMP
jgi:hypothetical protein